MKSTNDTGGMVNKIESLGREVENMEKLCEIQLIMIGEQLIPQFKAGKQALYAKLASQFNVVEISNVHQIASYWNELMNYDQIKNLKTE
jgi:hypothetical protein